MCVHIEPHIGVCNHHICVSKETNGKEWKPGKSAEDDSGRARSAKESMKEQKCCGSGSRLPGKELSLWIVPGKRQLTAGGAKRGVWEPFQLDSQHAPPCTEWLRVPWQADLKNVKGKIFNPSPPPPSAELMVNKVFGAAVHACVLCVDRIGLEQTGRVIWLSSQRRLG